MTDHQEIRKPCYLPAREISLVEVDSDVPFEIGMATDNATLEDVLRLIAYPTALDIGDNKTPLSAQTAAMLEAVSGLFHGTLRGIRTKSPVNASMNWLSPPKVNLCRLGGSLRIRQLRAS